MRGTAPFRYPLAVTSSHQRVRIIGRYALFEPIGEGGMATVHLGRLLGRDGFTRIVAIKLLHASYAKDPEFVAMLLDEARITGLIQHPNVVSTLDVVTVEGELFVVMEYVHGVSLSDLADLARSRSEAIPVRIAAGILNGVLLGLHAAHEATRNGNPLGIVHRDVSPHNILVGQDGTPRLLDFGVAKAIGQRHVTRDGVIKGKLSYMAPEHFRGNATRQSDIYSAAVVLWEALTGKRLIGPSDAGPLPEHAIEPPSGVLSQRESGLTPVQIEQLDEVVMRALEADPADRFATAHEMALALQASVAIASPAEVGDWVTSLAKEALATRAAIVAEIERASLDDIPRTRRTNEVASDAASPRRRRAVIVVAAAMLCGVLLVALRQPTPAPASNASTSAASASVPPPPVSASPSTTTGSATGERGPQATPSQSAPRAAPPVVHFKAPPPSPHGHPAASRACDPPYVLDSAGRKVFKDECLR